MAMLAFVIKLPQEISLIAPQSELGTRMSQAWEGLWNLRLNNPALEVIVSTSTH
jgi:hypothetical protein